METFGEKLKEIRKRKGMSQQELANMLGTSFPGVSQWESGRRNPKSDTICNIADALGVSVTELVSFYPAERGCVISMEEELAGLRERLSSLQQHEASNAPIDAVSVEDQIDEAEHSVGFLESAREFFVNYALVTKGYRPPEMLQRPDCPAGRGESHPAGVAAAMAEMPGLLEAADLPPGQARLLQGLIPVLYDTVAAAIRAETGPKAEGEGTLHELYGLLNRQGRQTAVTRLKELLQIPAYVTPPVEDADG